MSALNPIERGWRALRSLITETVVFTAGVRLAEAHPEASISLARACLSLVSEAMGQLSGLGEKDASLQETYEELEVARDLFASILVGESVSPIARKTFPGGVGGRGILILDIAHSHVHRAIDLLRRSKDLEPYREPLRLLSEARRESAPTTLYKLAYEVARSRG